MLLAQQFLGQQRHLRQFGGVGQARHFRQALLDRHLHRGGFGQQVVAAQAFVAAEQLAHVLRRVAQRGGFGFHHVRVELGRTAHGLAGVVDDEVQARVLGRQFAAEGLHARRVAQVQAEDLQPVRPVAEIGFVGITRRRIAREAGGDDQLRTGAQQLQARLVADLDPPAGQQRDAPAQVGQFGALEEIELRAVRAHLVVEVVDQGVFLLAHVAVAQLRRFQWLADFLHAVPGDEVRPGGK